MSIKIPHACIRDADIEVMEKRLTIENAKPLRQKKNIAAWMIKPEKLLFLQKEGSYVYVPFFWGKEYFGKHRRPDATDCYPIPKQDVPFLGVLRPEQKQIQKEAITALNETSSCLIAVYPGGGKCLAKGTLVRMFDFSVKKVEDICVGDRLRGPDEFPRTVVSLGHGSETMYTIRDRHCENTVYTVNRSHIMTVFSHIHQQIMDLPLTRMMDSVHEYGGVYHRNGQYEIFDMEISISDETEYFGFTLLENPRFLLANDVCTHNTITSLSICGHIGLRTLIIVNKLVLIDQWKTAIEKVYANTAFVIQGKTKKIPPHHLFYIINAVNVPKHGREVFEDLRIGVVVVDECHLIMTKVFSSAMAYLCPRYLIGLSATPYRNDGFHVLFELYFGMRRIVRKLYRPHDVYEIKTGLVIEAERDSKGDILWNSVIDQQTSSEERCTRIIDLCQKFPKRSILILSKRIAQIDMLYDRLKTLGESVTMMKESDTRFDEDARILISTFQKVGTGFSHDRLDMLILGCDVEEYFMQYLGRVFRRPDVEPIICDLVDENPILKKHYRSRVQVYLDAGGRIHRNKLS